MIRIIPLRAGWDPQARQDRDFPEDLPADWRLTYFSNEFLGVLVPPALWAEAGGRSSAGWIAETPARFRFYLDLGGQPDERTLAAVLATLGNRLGGLVGDAQVLARLPTSVAPPCFLAPSLHSQGHAGGPLPTPPRPYGLAFPVPATIRSDLRLARRWIEDLASQAAGPEGLLQDPGKAPAAILALLGDCNLTELRQWDCLVELMGLG